ncbi:MAG: M56 family metallopeptidase [Planctomycetaceae bacterium]
MNTLLICGLQVTLVAFVGSLTSLLMRRWLRASATLPIATTLIAIVLLTACAFSSWPSWLHRAGSVSATTTARPESAQPAADHARTADMTLETFGWREAALAAWNGLMDQNTATRPTESNGADSPQHVGWTALQIAGVVFALGFGVGLVRLLGGLWSVQHFVRTSRPLKTPSLIEELDVLRAELGCCPAVEIRECRHLATAATVGWRKPVVLLSDSWRSWSKPQLRSVLAHEIAHITRNDYLAGIAAQLGVVLHFYHPLVHWLVSRFRLEQELAADELAAGVVGGSRAYLNAIGELALKQSNETLGWPAQAFLPTRSTFLRRIEMLRDLKLLSGKAPLAIRAGTLGAIAAVTLVAVGLRPPGGEGVSSAPAVAAEKPLIGVSEGKQAVKPLEAKYVPLNAGFVIVIRSGEVIRTLDKVSPQLMKLFPGHRFGGSEQVVVFHLLLKDNKPAEGVCVTYADKVTRDQNLEMLGFKPDNVTKKKFLTFEYEQRLSNGSEPNCCYKPDDLTMIIGSEEVVQQAMLTGSKSLSPVTQTSAWKAATGGAAVFALDPGSMKPAWDSAQLNPMLKALSPLWESATSLTLGVTLDQKTNLTLTGIASDEGQAEKVKTAMEGGVSMLTVLLNALKQNPDPALSKLASEDLMPMLAAHQLTLTGKEATLKISSDTEKLASILVVPLTAAREAATLTQQKNNLKMIMLAMHNYHAVHNHFPPAVVIDQSSGVPRSWRVELLPLLDQQKLYDQYMKNEPWDSEANLKVLAQMPVVFKDLRANSETNNTAVTAAYGKNLAFEPGDKEGRKIPDFTDGLSNTISIIGVQTEIPWTKPEDITIDVTQDKLPQLGSAEAGYLFGIGDGSVRRAPGNVDVNILKIALTRNGGEVFTGF